MIDIKALPTSTSWVRLSKYSSSSMVIFSSCTDIFSIFWSKRQWGQNKFHAMSQQIVHNLLTKLLRITSTCRIIIIISNHTHLQDYPIVLHSGLKADAESVVSRKVCGFPHLLQIVISLRETLFWEHLGSTAWLFQLFCPKVPDPWEFLKQQLGNHPV